MTYDQAAAILKRVTYKPGYVLRLERHDVDDLTVLKVDFVAQDATNPRRTIPIRFQEAIPVEYLRSEEHFVRLVREKLRMMELHELDEWLQLDGRAPFYPH